MTHETRVARGPLTSEDRAVLGKAARRLIPLMGLLYVVSFLDRVNVSYAALTMNADIGLSASAFGLGAGIFFIGYFFFEVPSNLILHRVGARTWIARILVTWGLVAMGMAWVQGPNTFLIGRFLLGPAVREDRDHGRGVALAVARPPRRCHGGRLGVRLVFFFLEVFLPVAHLMNLWWRDTPVVDGVRSSAWRPTGNTWSSPFPPAGSPRSLVPCRATPTGRSAPPSSTRTTN